MLAPALALTAALAASPAAGTYALDPAASSARFHVVHKLHRVDGESRALEGKAVVKPDGTVLAMVRAPVASFRSGDGNRDAHMLEVLEAGSFRFVVFKGIAHLDGPAVAASGGRETTLEMAGELELHGVKRPLSLPLRIEPGPDGTVRARGSFAVSLDAHRVERPSLLFVRIDDACGIDLELVLREVKP
jgi:polyisoprenoid-binding protein YceI